MEKKFPELGMKQEDCKEMRWVESTRRTSGFPMEHPLQGQTFLNYKDLDPGRVKINGATFVDPRIWGRMYFKSNFPRLVKAKSNVDPENFFRVNKPFHLQ
ncbi:hypothetical protein Sjap_011749 [Stephania japonica]|uniref:Berberine/berberine-like domain-containing protein n=1 Tax=Stephania japonica TaxID=461633 RepID=A0AAP0JBQ9_9MAGN